MRTRALRVSMLLHSSPICRVTPFAHIYSSVPTVVNGVTTIKTLPGLVGVDWAADRFIEGLAMDKAIITVSETTQSHD